LCRMVTARENTVVERPIYFSPTGAFHPHKGFNWRALRRRIHQALNVERTMFSPVGLPGGFISSQTWFICKRRRAENASNCLGGLGNRIDRVGLAGSLDPA